MRWRYVPTLPLDAASLSALRQVPPGVAASVVPLLVRQPQSGVGSTGLLAAAALLREGVPPGMPVYFDSTAAVAGDHVSLAKAYASTLEQTSPALTLVPVVHAEEDGATIEEVRDVLRVPLGLRVDPVRDGWERVYRQILTAMAYGGRSAGRFHLLVDVGPGPITREAAATFCRRLVRIPSGEQFASVVAVYRAVRVPEDGRREIPRLDRAHWRTMALCAAEHDLAVDFGDGAVPRPGAAALYTGATEWRVVPVGEGVEAGAVASSLVSDPLYAGASFSAGDRALSEWDAEAGTAEALYTALVNHHVVLTARGVMSVSDRFGPLHGSESEAAAGSAAPGSEDPVVPPGDFVSREAHAQHLQQLQKARVARVRVVCPGGGVCPDCTASAGSTMTVLEALSSGPLPHASCEAGGCACRYLPVIEDAGVAPRGGEVPEPVGPWRGWRYTSDEVPAPGTVVRAVLEGGFERPVLTFFATPEAHWEAASGERLPASAVVAWVPLGSDLAS
ncbi:MAG: hypothetical protein R3181_00120 [Rubricoccaceae bacterium]|nr:hypothetical protein [Rubricoccaceae bacterium]